jgi:hypothetical protein
MTMRGWMLGLAGMLLLSSGHAGAACREGAIETRHQVKIAGRTIAYTACVGTLPVRDDAGRVRGSIFYTAYFAPSAKPRPLSFIWNGGPGADSRLLHLHALGPKVVRGGKLVDNPASLLATSDLVFVDPVGTAFSTAASPADAARFYGTVGDIDATARFITSFRASYGRGASPLYLMGESFGTWRAAGVAELLIDQHVPVRGIALISGGIPLGDRDDRSLMRALSVPNRTATAFALKRLPADLQADRAKALAAAESWARTVYRPALANPSVLSEADRTRIIAEAARFHGLDPAVVDARTLWISPRDFRTKLIPGRSLDIFDMRKLGGTREASEAGIALGYFRDTLGYKAGSYIGLEPDAAASDAGGRWKYDQSPITPDSLARAQAGEGPPSASQPWVLRAMEKAPRLRTWVAAGIYDSLNSCAANIATVAGLPKAVGKRVSLNCYPGGHMMYEDPDAMLRFGRELARFVR